MKLKRSILSKKKVKTNNFNWLALYSKRNVAEAVDFHYI